MGHPGYVWVREIRKRYVRDTCVASTTGIPRATTWRTSQLSYPGRPNAKDGTSTGPLPPWPAAPNPPPTATGLSCRRPRGMAK